MNGEAAFWFGVALVVLLLTVACILAWLPTWGEKAEAALYVGPEDDPAWAEPWYLRGSDE